VYETAPLAPGETMTAEVRWANPQEENVGVSWSLDDTAHERLRQLIHVYRPGADGWANPHASYGGLSVYGGMPATAQAYKWLWEDLHRLKLVERMPPVFED
jgi:hypothetical protein